MVRSTRGPHSHCRCRWYRWRWLPEKTSKHGTAKSCPSSLGQRESRARKAAYQSISAPQAQPVDADRCAARCSLCMSMQASSILVQPASLTWRTPRPNGLDVLDGVTGMATWKPSLSVCRPIEMPVLYSTWTQRRFLIYLDLRGSRFFVFSSCPSLLACLSLRTVLRTTFAGQKPETACHRQVCKQLLAVIGSTKSPNSVSCVLPSCWGRK